MPKFFVVAWRPPGKKPYFFRGDNRYEIFLPYISEEHVSRGWVTDIEYARVFEAFPVFDRRSFSRNFNAERMRVFEYEGEILPTQIVRPIKRPSQRRHPPFD